MNKFSPQELDPFTRMKLEKESPNVQRLIWLLEMKRATLKGRTRDKLNDSRNEMIRKMMSNGINYKEICVKAERYKTLKELVTN